MDTRNAWASGLEEASGVLATFRGNPKNIDSCTRFSEILIEAFGRHANVFSCGNGGSHCDAMHFAEELTGRYRGNRRPLGALALGDPSHVTCVSNDYGFEEVFARQLVGLARPGDVIVGFSTSGNSENVCRAFEEARRLGLATVALVGREGGRLKTLADLAIVVPGSTSDRIQEIHIKLVHLVIETIERQLFPENYDQAVATLS